MGRFKNFIQLSLNNRAAFLYRLTEESLGIYLFELLDALLSLFWLS